MGGNYWMALLLAPFVGAAVGFALERLIVQHLYTRPMATILATWGVSLMIQQILQIVFGSGPQQASGPIEGSVEFLGTSYPAYRLLLISFAAAIIAAIVFVFRKTRFGLDLRAVIQDRDMAEAQGINTRRIYTIAFCGGAGIAAIAGVLIAPLTKVIALMGASLPRPLLLRRHRRRRGRHRRSGRGERGDRRAGDAAQLPGAGHRLPGRGAGRGGGHRPLQAARAHPGVAAMDGTGLSPGRGRNAALSNPWVLLTVGLVAIAAAYPSWTDAYSLSVIRDALIFALLALSLDYLWGKAGILSFGHAAFFGIGAYSMAIFGPKVDSANAALVGLLAGTGIAGAVALVIGYFLIFGGVRGAYLTIVTLAISLVAQHIAIGWSKVTGGDSGLIGAPPPGIEIFGFSYVMLDPVHQYYLILAVTAIALLAIWLACSGHYGRVLAAIQDNELRARTLGYNTSLHLLIVFVVSAMLAAVAGGLYDITSGYVAPDLIGLFMSTEIIVWVAVGGRGTLIGPIIGAFVVIRLQQEVSSVSYKLWPMFIGAFFVAMVFLFPNGLLPLLRRIPRIVASRLQGARKAE